MMPKEVQFMVHHNVLTVSMFLAEPAFQKKFFNGTRGFKIDYCMTKIKIIMTTICSPPVWVK